MSSSLKPSASIRGRICIRVEEGVTYQQPARVFRDRILLGFIGPEAMDAPLRRTRSDRQGRFLLEDLPPGEWRLHEIERIAEWGPGVKREADLRFRLSKDSRHVVSGKDSSEPHLSSQTGAALLLNPGEHIVLEDMCLRFTREQVSAPEGCLLRRAPLAGIDAAVWQSSTLVSAILCGGTRRSGVMDENFNLCCGEE